MYVYMHIHIHQYIQFLSYCTSLTYISLAYSYEEVPIDVPAKLNNFLLT